MQSAYEILSDPQERAWYDTHRDTILRDQDDSSGGQYDHDVRITTADDILRMFTRFHGRIDYSDAPMGFYGFLRESFETLAREEQLACEWEGFESVAFPSFGHAKDGYEDVVRPFYAIWNGFATKKNFSWEDVYRYSEAPDRRVRRMMEKENKRFRDEGVAKFNNAVRCLVAFAKKRDPRFKPTVQTEAERQKVLRDAAVAQAARSRAANQAKYTEPGAVPDWMRSTGSEEEDGFEGAEEEIQEQFECIVCRKNFKSERQYDAHERSKKHVKAVQHLRRQMQQEDKTLNLDKSSEPNDAQSSATDAQGGSEFSLTSSKEASSPALPATQNGSDGDEDVDSGTSTEMKRKESTALENKDPRMSASAADAIPDPASSSEDDIYASRETVENRFPNGVSGANGPHTSESDVGEISVKLASESLEPQPRLGKAKEKRAKKAAQKVSATAASGLEFKCTSCQAEFPSKTRLFNHIKDFGHAQPVLKPSKGGGKGKKR